MGFNLYEIEDTSFNSLKELKEYTVIEKANTVFVPIKNYLDNEALFADDEYFGFKKNWLTFNNEGFRQFCRKFGIPHYFLQELQGEDLVSEILNDYINIGYVKKELITNQFVIDKSLNRIMGIVSNTYTDYSNKDFLEDIEKAYSTIFEEYEIAESFIINTKLYLRLLSPKIISGYAKGEYYEGNDISQVGLQLKNSMIGNSAVRIDYFIFRAICSNGLVVNTFNNKNKILHSGKRETFVNRLEKKIRPIMKDIKQLPEILKELVEIEYNPYTLAKLGATDYIYKIIPLSDYEYEKRRRLRKDDRIDYDHEQISRIPNSCTGKHSKRVFKSCFRNNQSLFDYVNIFTEYAHSNGKSKKQRVYIEEKTGEFVNWILENKSRIIKENSNSLKYQQLRLV